MNITIPYNPVFAEFQRKPSFSTSRVSDIDVKTENPKKESLKKAIVCTAATVGMLAGLALVGKQQGINTFTKKGYGAIDYTPIAMSTIASCSLLGGVGLGIAIDKKNTRNKIREGIQQFVGNILFPIMAVAGGEWIYKKYGTNIKTPVLKGGTKFIENFNHSLNRLPRVGTTLASLMIGLFIGNKMGNILNNLIFKDIKGRNLELTDASGHLDDFCVGASLVTRGTAISDVISKFIPPALIVAGYIAGTKTDVK